MKDMNTVSDKVQTAFVIKFEDETGNYTSPVRYVSDIKREDGLRFISTTAFLPLAEFYLSRGYVDERADLVSRTIKKRVEVIEVNFSEVTA